MGAAVFDFDGTIADTIQIFIKVMNELAEPYGYEQIKDVNLLKVKSTKLIIREDLGISMYKLPGYVRKFKDVMRPYMADAKLHKGVPTLMAELRKTKKVGVLTSNETEEVKKVLAKHKIEVDFVFGGSSLFGKHRSMKRMLRKEDLTKEEVTYVGDEVRDAQACEKVGIRMVGVTWGFNSEEALREAGVENIANTVTQLKKYLI